MPPLCYVQPDGNAAHGLETRVVRAGLEPTTDPERAEAVIWSSNLPEGLEQVLAAGPCIRWVQLPIAGIERFVPIVRARADLVWTCAKVAFGPAVAELTVGLLIAGFRQLHRYAAARSWHPVPSRLLAGARVAVLGGGGIGQQLIPRLVPFGAGVTVVSRSGAPIDGARTVTMAATMEAVATADAVVLALPLTDETAGLVGRRFLQAMQPHAWLVNVARGAIVVTDDLVDALRREIIGGAALDVTDPEPLPDGHPLWDLPNAIVTPHVANTPTLGAQALGDLVEDNARRFAAGQPLRALVDPLAGY